MPKGVVGRGSSNASQAATDATLPSRAAGAGALHRERSGTWRFSFVVRRSVADPRDGQRAHRVVRPDARSTRADTSRRPGEPQQRDEQPGGRAPIAGRLRRRAGRGAVPHAEEHRFRTVEGSELLQCPSGSTPEQSPSPRKSSLAAIERDRRRTAVPGPPRRAFGRSLGKRREDAQERREVSARPSAARRSGLGSSCDGAEQAGE